MEAALEIAAEPEIKIEPNAKGAICKLLALLERVIEQELIKEAIYWWRACTRPIGVLWVFLERFLGKELSEEQMGWALKRNRDLPLELDLKEYCNRKCDECIIAQRLQRFLLP